MRASRDCRRASAALRRYLQGRAPLISSALARTEVLRALLPAGEEAVSSGRTVLQFLELVRVDDRVLTAAGLLLPAELESLDAIHLATVAQLGDDLRGLVTNDDSMGAAAKRLGYKPVSPC